jgi:hypothetical protein
MSNTHHQNGLVDWSTGHLSHESTATQTMRSFLYPEDGGSISLRNSCKHPQNGGRNYSVVNSDGIRKWQIVPAQFGHPFVLIAEALTKVVSCESTIIWLLMRKKVTHIHVRTDHSARTGGGWKRMRWWWAKIINKTLLPNMQEEPEENSKECCRSLVTYFLDAVIVHNMLLHGFNSASELYRLSNRHWSANFSVKFCGKRDVGGQRGWTPTAVNLSFLDRSRSFLFQVVPHLSSRGWVDPVPDPLLLRKSGSVGKQTRDLWVYS